jgi:Raf kinase inhibitor-like YbhB/YbcL family protein
MPTVYSCDGKDVSPPLRWTAPPRAARSLALRVVDTDAGFTHWTAWGISPRSRGLASGQRPTKQGRNDFGRVGYGGPCPPSGTHHYVFVLYALARPLRIATGASSSRFASALRAAHVLAHAKLVGTYRR